MIKKICLVAFLIVTCVLTSSCNYFAKKIGGDITIDLPKGEKFVNATWRDSNSSLWYVTRPMKEGEDVTTYTFQEDSNFGVLEGRVFFVEHK